MSSPQPPPPSSVMAPTGIGGDGRFLPHPSNLLPSTGGGSPCGSSVGVGPGDVNSGMMSGPGVPPPGAGGNLLAENSHCCHTSANPSPSPGGVVVDQGGNTTTNWAPSIDHINEIVSLFSKAGSLDNAVQQQLAQAFQQLNQMPDSPSYLTCILSNPEFPPDVRQLAGLTLKSTLQQQRALGMSSPPNVTNYIRPLLLNAITDSDRGVRQAAGSAITMLLSIEGIASWPAALQRLFQLLDDPRDEVLDGAFSALSKVVEDALAMLMFFPNSRPGGVRRMGVGMGEDDTSQHLGVDEEVFAQFCITFLLPKLFTLALPGNKPAVRSYAVNCLSHFVQRNRAFGPNEVFESFFPQYWNLLGQLAQESDPEMRRFVVQGMVQVVEVRPDVVLNVSSGDAVLSFMVRCCGDDDYHVRLDALEFWPVIMRDIAAGGAGAVGGPLYEYREQVLDLVRGHLRMLLPVLVHNTKYHEYDYLCMDQHQLEDENANVADEESDLKPRFHRSSRATANNGGAGDGCERGPSCSGEMAGKNKTTSGSGGGGTTGSGGPNAVGGGVDTTGSQGGGGDIGENNNNNSTGGYDEDGEENDDDDEFASSKGTWGDGWTVRKGSALALDHIASVYREDILPEVLPLIEKRLVDPDWEVRESAVLTFGALAQGCQDRLEPYLPNVLDYLLKLCDDPKPLLRSISCWCISRYASWICRNHDRFLQPALAQVLKHVIDKNKRVQEAACSAFATIEEEACSHLIPFLPDIISTLKQAFQFYQTKNLLILYDAVGTLADSVGSALATEQYSRELMEPLFTRWSTIRNVNDPTLIGLFECITNCATALKDHFLPYAQPVTERCVMLLMQSLTGIDRFEKGEQPDRPSRDLIEACLDLLSGVTEALGPKMPQLLAQPNLNFVPLLQRCCNDPSPGMLQSSFALVGDLSKHCVQFLQPHLGSIIPLLSEHLLHHATSVQNNAGWAIGELALRAAPEYLDPHVDTIVSKLIGIVNCPELHRSLLQNVCISLGRLGLVCPSKMAPHLGEFLQQWCIVMRSAKNDEEKANGFEGICALIELNPSGCTDSLYELVLCMLAFHPCPDPLNQKFALVLQALSQKYPEQWRILHDITQTERPFLPVPMQNILGHRFFGQALPPPCTLNLQPPPQGANLSQGVSSSSATATTPAAM